MTTIAETFGHKAPKQFKLKPTISTTFPDLVMGAELEIEGCDEGTIWQDVVSKIGFRVENDGSLRGRNNPNGNDGIQGLGLEFISAPMESDVLATAVHQFFKETKFTEKNYSDRCSVHVHVNCQNLQWADVASISLLYSVVEDCLFHFIGNGRSNNIFCIPWSQCRISYDLLTKLTSEQAVVPHSWQKYTAMNLQPLERYGTVEFRHMEGTHDPERIVQWLNIIGCLFRYCRGTNVSDLMKEVLALNTSSDYRGFFDRVFLGNLKYSDEFEQMLENGVIQAKLQSINYGKEKPRKQDEPVDPGTFRFTPPRPVSPRARNRATVTFDDFIQAAPDEVVQPAPIPVNDVTRHGALSVDDQGRPIHPRNPEYTEGGWYNFTADSRSLGVRLGDYSRRYGVAIGAQEFISMYATIQEVEHKLWEIIDAGERISPRGLGENNSRFRQRVNLAVQAIRRARSARIDEYRNTVDREPRENENHWGWSIRTGEDSDWQYYTGMYGVTRQEAEALWVTMGSREGVSIAQKCRNVLASQGRRMPVREQLN